MPIMPPPYVVRGGGGPTDPPATGPSKFPFLNAIEFDGNDFMNSDFPSSPAIDNLLRPGDGTKASWTFWTKVNAAALDATARGAFGKGPSRYGLQKAAASNHARVFIGDGTSTLTGTWNDYWTDLADVWAHVAVVWDASQSTNATKLKLYKNGTLVTATGYGGSAPAAIATSTSTFDICNEGNGGAAVLYGIYDEFTVHSVALTAAEVLLNSQQYRISRGVVERWKMDEGTGVVTTGQIASTVMNFTPFGGDPAWVVHT